MWVLVDIMEVQGQDVVLAANIHAIMVLVHTKDPVVRRVEEVGKVMSSTSRSQLCMESEKHSLLTAADTCALFVRTHACTTNTFLLPLLRGLI